MSRDDFSLRFRIFSNSAEKRALEINHEQTEIWDKFLEKAKVKNDIQQKEDKKKAEEKKQLEQVVERKSAAHQLSKKDLQYLHLALQDQSKRQKLSTPGALDKIDLMDRPSSFFSKRAKRSRDYWLKNNSKQQNQAAPSNRPQNAKHKQEENEEENKEAPLTKLNLSSVSSLSQSSDQTDQADKNKEDEVDSIQSEEADKQKNEANSNDLLALSLTKNIDTPADQIVTTLSKNSAAEAQINSSSEQQKSLSNLSKSSSVHALTNEEFLSKTGPLAKLIEAVTKFGSNRAINELGEWELWIELDTELLSDTELIMCISVSELLLRFTVNDASTNTLICRHAQALNYKLTKYLKKRGYPRTVKIELNGILL